MTNNQANTISSPNSSDFPDARPQTLSYFILAVLGFSFWFFMAVPFASHRESYSWLSGACNEHFVQQLSFTSKTYRPLAQVTTWLGFLVLDPRTFPTSVLRQALLQGCVYGLFVIGWWFIYSAAPERRLFALTALISGCVFFSSYVQLFHIYGLFYVPVILILGVLLRFHDSRSSDKQEVWLALVATLLAFWHPFATALFVGFYSGFYLDTFRQRSRAQHIEAIIILLVAVVSLAALVVAIPLWWHSAPPLLRQTANMPVNTRLFGFLVSYQTNEVNRIASVVAFLLTQMVVFSMSLTPKLKFAAAIVVSVFSIVFLVKGLPLLTLWIGAVLLKLLRGRCWSLFFLTLTAALLPFGGGIGTPIYALFAIILATYVTPLGWPSAEQALSFVKPRFVAATIIASVIVLVMMRMGIRVPIVSRVASPLLTERERTYQLETVLAWLHNSDYCGYGIAFAENSGNPIDSIESVITRKNRPPSGIEDVQTFWNNELRCNSSQGYKAGTAIVTFDAPALAHARAVFTIKGRYAGDATVWIADSKEVADYAYHPAAYNQQQPRD